MPEARNTINSDSSSSSDTGISVSGPMNSGFDDILTQEALEFIASLEKRFGDERRRLIEARAVYQEKLDAGEKPHFLPETAKIREGDWTIRNVPADLQDRRVEITGPVDRKMVINALNSGAKVFMADFEDATSPTWNGMIQGQINLRDAVRRDITFEDPRRGKSYALGDSPATLLVRPRGWHLEEAHITLDGRPVSGSLVDFGLYFFHNIKEMLRRNTGPYFYLPKLENHHEAKLWNDVFVAAQEALGVPLGTIKVTVLIETITASFEMDEILYVLRDHIVEIGRASCRERV